MNADTMRQARAAAYRAAHLLAQDAQSEEGGGLNPAQAIAQWCHANMQNPEDLEQLIALLTQLLDHQNDPDGGGIVDGDPLSQAIRGGGDRPRNALAGGSGGALAHDSASERNFLKTFPDAARIGIELTHRPPSALAALDPRYADDVPAYASGFALDEAGRADEESFYAMFPNARRLA